MKKTKITISVLIALIIILKSISFYLSWDYTSVQTLKLILSVAYYISMMGLMHYSSKYKKSTIIFCGIFLIEWLMVLIGLIIPNTISLLKIPLVLVECFMLASHQLVFPLVEYFEFLGNYRVFLLMLIYVGFIMINVLSRRSKDVKNKVE